jgi:hypothetical protein
MPSGKQSQAETGMFENYRAAVIERAKDMFCPLRDCRLRDAEGRPSMSKIMKKLIVALSTSAMLASMPPRAEASWRSSFIMNPDAVTCPAGTCNPRGGPRAKNARMCRPENCGGGAKGRGRR